MTSALSAIDLPATLSSPLLEPGRAEQVWRPPAAIAPTGARSLWNVTRPTLTPVLPSGGDRVDAGVVICPGGGYFGVAIDHEGLEVAEWLAERGFTAFVLKYRVMTTYADDDDGFLQVMTQGGTPEGFRTALRKIDEFAPVPRADGLEALRTVRSRASEWGLSGASVGVIGFSAGARLAVDLATAPSPEARPDFVGALYGSGGGLHVPADAPPLYTAVAADDVLHDQTLATENAWREAGVPVESHHYAAGGHGFGMVPLGLPSDHWIESFAHWLRHVTRSAGPWSTS